MGKQKDKQIKKSKKKKKKIDLKSTNKKEQQSEKKDLQLEIKNKLSTPGTALTSRIPNHTLTSNHYQT